MSEADFARARLPGRTYVSKSFPLPVRRSRDHGLPARFVCKAFDEDGRGGLDRTEPDIEWTEEIVYESPGGRKQVRVQLAREAGRVREVQIQRVPRRGGTVRQLRILGGRWTRRFDRLATTLSDVLGRPIAFHPRTFDEDKRAMMAAGLPEPIAEQNAQAFGLIAEGDAEWLSEDVEGILGHPGRSFEQFARDHAAAFTA